MTTNLLATILLVTNTVTVVHWPQVFQGYKDPWSGKTLPMSDSIPGRAEFVCGDDTNSDTRTDETTVTQQRLLSFEFEDKSWTELLSQSNVAHYQVEMKLERTNATVRFEGERIETLQGILHFNPSHSALLEYPTNYWVPVRTNSILPTMYITNTGFNIPNPHGLAWIINTNNAIKEIK